MKGYAGRDVNIGIASRITRRLAPLRSIAVLTAALLANCGGDAAAPGDPALSIDLRWIEGYDGESRSDVETGLLWTLSFLGAALPARGPDPLSWRDEVVTLRLDDAGIDADTLPHWKRLLTLMKGSEEYRAKGALDVGRFVALTLCSSNHYYALTGAATHYDQVQANHVFGSEPAAVVESAVSHGNRLVEIGEGTTIADVAFIAHEGSGTLSQDTFLPKERELLDIMKNGQLRFAMYDADGRLKPAAAPKLTEAGKPTKCLWCHETHLLRPFKGRTSVPGYASLDTFAQRVAQRMDEIQVARSALDARVDFRQEQDHTYAELLYLSFYEPSAERVAREWGVPVAAALEALAGLPTHAQEEFKSFAPRLYRRSDVDALAPYGVIEPPTDPREPSSYEPDLLR